MKLKTEGTWWVFSDIDPRWNKSGKGYDKNPSVIQNWVEKCKKKYGKPPYDLYCSALLVEMTCNEFKKEADDFSSKNDLIGKQKKKRLESQSKLLDFILNTPIKLGVKPFIKKR
jgi:hypothetical protein